VTYDDIPGGLIALINDAEQQFRDHEESAPATVAIGARTRRRRSMIVVGAVAFVTVVAIGVSAVGVTTSSRVQAATSPSPSPTASEDLSVPIKSATFALAGGPGYSGVEALVECGAPVPVATGIQDGFGISFADLDPITLDIGTSMSGRAPRVGAEITYDYPEDLPVAQTPIVLAVVKDNQIVGRFFDDGPPTQYLTYSDAISLGGTQEIYPFGTFCPDVLDERGQELGWEVLAAGDYQVIPVARIWADEEVAALRDVKRQGVDVENLWVGFTGPTDGSLDYQPGSWDCDRIKNYGYSTRACLGSVIGTAIVDSAAQTVTLPYDPADLVRTFDVTVVGAPVDIKVTGTYEYPGQESYVPIFKDASQPLKCLEEYDFISSAAPIAMTTAPSGNGDTGMFRAQFGEPVDVRILTAHGGKGRVTFGPDSRLWIYRDSSGEDTYFEPRPGNKQILGYADLTVVGGNSFEYDRFAGPSDVTLNISDVTWCDGVAPNGSIAGYVMDIDLGVTPLGQAPVALQPTLIDTQQQSSF